MMRLEATGFDEAIKAIELLPGRLQKNVIVTANRNATKVFAEAVRSRAPVRRGDSLRSDSGWARPPGYLRSQIKVKKVRKQFTPYGGIAHVVHKGAAFYSRFVTKGEGNVGRGNPFVQRAYDASRNHVQNVWRQEFVKGFNRQVRRLNRG